MRTLLIVITSLLLALSTLTSYAQRSATIAFYNVENLFDDVVDSRASKKLFSLRGRRAWLRGGYDAKLSNIDSVICSLSMQCGDFPAIIGLAEVVSRKSLDDLLSRGGLDSVEYDVIHYDSPDTRGIDVAVLFRPSIFALEGSHAIKADIPDVDTRDILTLWGTLYERDIFIVVVHLPSRVGGTERSQYKRDTLMGQLRTIVDSVQRLSPSTHIVVMGDFNDNPTDISMEEILAAKGDVDRLREGDLFNPFNELFRMGYGTAAYRDEWNLFDNIVVSQSLLRGDGGLELSRSQRDSVAWGDIFMEEFLFQSEGYFRGYPLKSHFSGAFQGGYSDHLPVYIRLQEHF